MGRPRHEYDAGKFVRELLTRDIRINWRNKWERSGNEPLPAVLGIAAPNADEMGRTAHQVDEPISSVPPGGPTPAVPLRALSEALLDLYTREARPWSGEPSCVKDLRAPIQPRHRLWARAARVIKCLIDRRTCLAPA